MLRFLFTVLMCNLLCTLKAQSDSSYRSTGFTLFIGGSINSFDNEPRVALLDCATIGLGLHRNNGNLYLAYSRGNATTATFDGLGLGGELYLEKSKLSCDAILAVNRGSLFGWSTGLVTLGGIVVTDDQAFFLNLGILVSRKEEQILRRSCIRLSIRKNGICTRRMVH